MTREYEMDPEVAADIALRNRTMRERRHAAETPAWQPQPIVAQWPCRAAGCTNAVEVTPDALERLDVFNRELKRRNEEPLDTNKIAICSDCQAKRWAMLANRNRDRVEKLAAAIRELRGGAMHPQPPGPAPNRAREVVLMRDIIALGHPDPDGLFKAIADARNAGGGRKARGAL